MSELSARVFLLDCKPQRSLRQECPRFFFLFLFFESKGKILLDITRQALRHRLTC